MAIVKCSYCEVESYKSSIYYTIDEVQANVVGGFSFAGIFGDPVYHCKNCNKTTLMKRVDEWKYISLKPLYVLKYYILNLLAWVIFGLMLSFLFETLTITYVLIVIGFIISTLKLRSAILDSQIRTFDEHYDENLRETYSMNKNIIRSKIRFK